MFEKSKYVIGIPKYGHCSLLQAVIIPETMAHSDIKEIFEEGSIKSAGFCSVNKGQLLCYGKSVSLGVCATNEDHKLVGQALNLPEYFR